MPFYSQHKEIALFIESVDQVLNSATVFIEQELKGTDILAFVDEAFRSGKFYHWMQEAFDDKRKTEIVPLDISFRLIPFSFQKFKSMLETMLAVERSPYRVNLAQNQIRFLTDDFIESTINADQVKSYPQRSAEIETSWRFYCMPRGEYLSDYELDDPGVEEEGLHKSMPGGNTDNYLADYFYGLGGDAFLIFHNNHKVYFLLTNGSD